MLKVNQQFRKQTLRLDSYGNKGYLYNIATGKVVAVLKTEGDETVIHPFPWGNEKPHKFRLAKEPYECTLYLADGTSVDVDLACEEDWGDIQGCLPDDCEDWQNSLGWGNDCDGHIKILKVTDKNDKEIPMDEFRQDVADFVVYFES
jgi:hypothetical protein